MQHSSDQECQALSERPVSVSASRKVSVYLVNTNDIRMTGGRKAARGGRLLPINDAFRKLTCTMFTASRLQKIRGRYFVRYKLRKSCAYSGFLRQSVR